MSPIQSPRFLNDSPKKVPEGWDLFVHPRGWIYFFNSSLKIITDQDIRDPQIYTSLRAHSQITSSCEWTDRMELLLQVNHAGDIDYFLAINHSHCVASQTMEDVTDEAVNSMDVYALNRRRRLYWNYLWSHPSHIPCPPRAIPDASDALNWFYTDNLLSGSRSKAPFSKLECEDLMKVLRDMQLPCNVDSTGKVVFLAWFLREVCSYRNAESYGLHTRPLTSPRAQTLHDREDARVISPHLTPLLYLVTNLLFFGIPWSYLAHVKSSFKYHGRFMSLQESWMAYIERLVREYSHFLLVVCYKDRATVGVLAIPEISAGSRAAAIVSAFFALGSLIVSVFSIWRHQANMLPSDFTYIRNANRHLLGLQGHAMLLSVPPVLLVWAIITFTLSIVVYTIEGVNNFDVFNRAVTWIALSAFILILVTVTITLHNTFSLVWHVKMSLGRSLGSILNRCIRYWQNTIRRSGIASVDKEVP
ncbi:hypothetical protein L218DRAFT_864859 [Marasmius fiardii PR-910]|nr:hypothetical protein L218DRAFT_864859 [Marasmius fiardii PR-910]